MENLNTWTINDTEYYPQIIQEIRDCEQIFATNQYILDLTKNKYTLIEKYVYDIAMFHFKRLNIDISDNHYIEFWCKDTICSNVSLHVDCDEILKRNNIYKYPLLSCVTYLNDNIDCPTIITNVDLECHKYKEFDKQTEVLLSLPKRNKQITFNGKYFHGTAMLNENAKITERYIIVLNFWDIKPKSVDNFIPNDNVDAMFTSKDEPIIDICDDDNSICSINVDNDVINYNFFNDILYNKPIHSCFRFNELINQYTDTQNKNTFKFILDNSISVKKHEVRLKNKYGDIIDDINAIENKTIELKYNRFLQRFQYNKIYSPDMCNFIINECEKYAGKNGGWTTKRHIKYPTTDLPVDKIPSIFGLIIESMNTILNKIKISYGLHEDIVIDIKDLFVVKYSHDAQNQLEMHCDGSFLSFSILLNNATDFEGGGTYFDDGLSSHLEQGDILIHSSQIKHSGLPVILGTRYLLVGFINLIMEPTHITK